MDTTCKCGAHKNTKHKKRKTGKCSCPSFDLSDGIFMNQRVAYHHQLLELLIGARLAARELSLFCF